MKKLLVLIFGCVAALAGCATTPNSTPAAPVQFVVNDFRAAETNYTNAANAQPKGSALQLAFANDAQCMASAAEKLSAVGGTSSTQIKGIFSLGSVLYIQTQELQSQLNQTGTGNSTCDALIGQVVTSINKQVLNLVPGAILRGGL